MKLSRVYRAELAKYLKKPITLVLLVGLILPVFYGLSIMQQASYLQVQGDFDAVTFASINWNMLTMTGIPEVLFALVAAHIFAYELERGQIRLTMVRVCDRAKLLKSKFLVLGTLVAALYVLFYMVCFAIYYTIIVNTPLGNGSFLNADTLHFMIIDWIYLIQIMMVCSITIYLGLHFKAFTSFMLGVGLVISLMFLEFFPVIKYFIPAYTANALSHDEISSLQAAALSALFMAVLVIPIYGSIKKFKEVDV